MDASVVCRQLKHPHVCVWLRLAQTYYRSQLLDDGLENKNSES